MPKAQTSQEYYAQEIAYARIEWSWWTEMPYDSPKSRWPSRREVFWCSLVFTPLLAWPWAWQIWRSLLIWTGQVPPVADGTGTVPTLLSDSTAGIADQFGLFIDICAVVVIPLGVVFLLSLLARLVRKVLG